MHSAHKLVFLATDIQFLSFMQVVTDLTTRKVYQVFDVLDVDQSGMIDFDEFYLLTCILLAVRVSECVGQVDVYVLSMWYNMCLTLCV